MKIYKGKIFCPHVDSLNCIAAAFHKHRSKSEYQLSVGLQQLTPPRLCARDVV